MTARRATRRPLAFVLLALLLAVAIPPARNLILRAAGHLLVAGDQPAEADLLTMDVESGAAGALKVADLYQARPSIVAVLERRHDTLDAALAARGVKLPDVTLSVLNQLGIPSSAIVKIPAGEGGTTETTAALAAWVRAHPRQRVLVVVGPSHGRRYRRALRRVWPDDAPPPRVVTTEFALFREADWWRSRTTLREGLVEIEKLVLDLLAHPLS